MDLRNWLEVESPDKYRQVMNVRAVVEPILRRPLHLDYTDHSIEHSDRVIEKLNGLTEGLMSMTPLSPTEVHILLASAYLHDMGMQDELAGGSDLQWIRDHHHDLIGKRILQSLEQYVRAVPLSIPLFPDPEIGVVIMRVAMAHRGEVDLSESIYEPSPYGAENIRPRLLAALLRFADELDTDFRRAPLEVLTLREIPADSLFHWYKCYYVKAVRIRDEYVEVWYRFPKGYPHYRHLIIPLVDAKIRAEFDSLQATFREHQIRLGLGSPRAVEIPGLQPMPPEVEEFAREQCIVYHREQIQVKMKEISFIQSPSFEMLEITDV